MKSTSTYVHKVTNLEVVKPYHNRAQIDTALDKISEHVDTSNPQDFEEACLYCDEQVALLFLVNMNLCYKNVQWRIFMRNEIKKTQEILHTKPSHCMARAWANHVTTMSKLEKLMLRRADTLSNEAATKIQRMWRAHAYNPDRSTFGIMLARQEFDLCCYKFEA
jgi:hypothetical protein